MASTLEDCTIEEQQDVITFLFSEGTKSSEIYSRMVKHNGKSCIYNTENRTLIQEDRRITESQINVIYNVSVVTAYTIIHDKLKYRKPSAHYYTGSQSS